MSDDEAKELSVRLELQADFLAGALGPHADKARHILEPGDLEARSGRWRHSAMTPEADPPGDVVTGSFTRCWHGRHGTAEQRARWFSRGFKTGDLTQGDTLEADKL